MAKFKSKPVGLRNWFKDEAERFFYDPDHNHLKQLRRDITNEFYATIHLIIGEKYDFFVGNANGLPGDGKSVLVLTLSSYIQEQILNKTWNEKCIDRDEQEFIEWIKSNPDEHDVMRVIDEHSALYEVGENSTTEKAYFTEYSDLFRSRHIYRWYCSPTYQVDKNTVLSIEVAGTNRKERRTQAYIYYNLFINGNSERVPLGYIDIYVGDTLDSEWYKQYEKRKNDRQALLADHGIQNMRQLIYAEMSKEVYNDLADEIEMGVKIDRDYIKSAMDAICQEKGIMLSMIGIEARIGEIHNTVKLKLRIVKELEEMKFLKHKYGSIDKMGFKDKISFENSIKVINILNKRLNKIIEGRWDKLIRIKNEVIKMESK